ncbi:MAG TPA: protein kinase [Labilithrix sp.]|nr:protein kinase [Labilithrix sp.]
MAEGSERKNPPAGPQKRVGSSVRGKYRVDAFLATGTMANVYAATHRNGSRVALKILHKQLSEDSSLCERFKREGYFANSIGHPGVVRAIDDDVTEDGCPFLVMELLEGETLEERRRRKGGRLPSAWVLPVADALLEILAAAHAREVVHRDLKPDNVFVTKSGDVKVLDFGVARWNDGQTSSDMTAVGMVLGTPAYMPPEQALGRREEVDAQSDIWAVGATLFVVLSGESVHVGGDAKAKLIATARTAARPLREAAPDVPRAVAAVIDRALAFHKSERWPDADAMREALRWARMAVEERPSQTGATSVPVPEPIPPPVETRRNFDDEPTLARILPRDDSMPGSVPSRDFLTSAPPITLRDVPKSTAVDPTSRGAGLASNSDPIFSLRRAKDGDAPVESRSPSTERLPRPEDGHPKAQSPALRTTPGIGELPPAPSMSSYDPSASDAMGIDAPVSSAQSSIPSVDVSLSFTRPMAAMVMPADWPPAPRPAAGAPPEQALEPPAYAAMFADHPEAFPPPAALPQPYPTGAPPAPPAVTSVPPPDFASSRQQPTLPPRRLMQPETAPSLRPHGEPGPMLSQIVKPSGGRLLRIGVPLVLAFLAVLAGFVALRTRAANARARASSVPATATTTAAETPTPVTAAAATAATIPGSAPPSSAEPAPAAIAVATPAPEPPPKKKKKRPRPPVVKPIEPVEPPPAEEPAPAPVDTTPPGDTGEN